MQYLATIASLLILITMGSGCVNQETPEAGFGQRKQAATGSGTGQELQLAGTSGALQYTHVWTIGEPNNITRIYFLNHGDGNSDYSSSTASDRSAMANRLPPGEGAYVAYPVSVSDDWPTFSSGENGAILLGMFRELEQMSGKQNIRFEQFSLSGGGRVNHALLRLVNEQYNSNNDVKEFVDNHFRGIHDGDSLCYSISSMRENYIQALESFPWVNACFIHNTSGTMSYVHGHHNTIAEHFNNGQGYPFGGTLSIQNGRLRFWSAPTHWEAWKGQFEAVFFDGPTLNGPNTPPLQDASVPPMSDAGPSLPPPPPPGLDSGASPNPPPSFDGWFIEPPERDSSAGRLPGATPPDNPLGAHPSMLMGGCTMAQQGTTGDTLFLMLMLIGLGLARRRWALLRWARKDLGQCDPG